MDDTDKTQGQTQNPQQTQGGGVSALVKERELPVASSAGPSVSEFVRPSGPEAEHKIDRELAGMDVRSVTEFPKVGREEQKAGIEPAGESVPVEPSGIVHPSIMTEEEARQTLKHAKPTDSGWGLAAVVVKFFKTIHHRLIQNSKFKSQN